MVAYHIPKCIQVKSLALTLILYAAPACSRMGGRSQWAQVPDVLSQQRSCSIAKPFDTAENGPRFFDLKQLPRHIFGCRVVPFMESKDVHNLILTAQGLRHALWEELPFLFKKEQRKRQLEHYLESPECLISIAAISLRQYMLKNYFSAIEGSSITLPSSLFLHKKIKMVDFFAIKSNLFIQCLDKFRDVIMPTEHKIFCSVSSSFLCYNTTDLLTYRKARLLTPIYNYLSLPTILNVLHISKDDQIHDSTQHAIYKHFSILSALQDVHASDKQRQAAQRLLQDILAAEGESWLSRFDFVQMAACYGSVLLNYEAACGCTEVSERLIRCGADINGEDCNKRTPLHYAVIYEQPSALKFLLANRIGQPNHWRDISTPPIAQSKFLVDSPPKRGSGIDYLDNTGQTPLHYACTNNHLESVRLLLKKGADVNRKDTYGDSALHMAVDSDALAIAKLLIKHGADTNARDNYGNTPLHQVVDSTNAHQRKSMLRLLLANNADINAQDYYGNTPLLDAIYSKLDLEAAKLFIAHGANVSNMPAPRGGDLLQWIECDLVKSKTLVWYSIMGDPPHDNERAKYLLFLAKMSGAKLTFQSIFHSMPHHSSKPLPLTISPQDTFFVLSQRSNAHIKELFGSAVLAHIKDVCWYQRVAKLLKKEVTAKT